MYISDQDAKILKQTKMTATFLVIAPITYLAMPILLSEQREFPHSEFLQFVSFMLLPVAAFIPFVFLMIEKTQIKAIRKRTKGKQTPGQIFSTLVIIKFSAAQLSFVFALIVFFLGGGISRMLWFYPIGMMWMFIFWPREQGFKKFLEQLEAK